MIRNSSHTWAVWPGHTTSMPVHWGNGRKNWTTAPWFLCILSINTIRNIVWFVSACPAFPLPLITVWANASVRSRKSLAEKPSLSPAGICPIGLRRTGLTATGRKARNTMPESWTSWAGGLSGNFWNFRKASAKPPRNADIALSPSWREPLTEPGRRCGGSPMKGHSAWDTASAPIMPGKRKNRLPGRKTAISWSSLRPGRKSGSAHGRKRKTLM